MIRCDSAARRVVAALSTAFLLAGCAHVRPADPTSAAVDLDDINATLAGRMVLVRLVDGTELLAHDVRVSADSVSLRRERFPDYSSAWPAREAEELPVSEVHCIEVTHRGRGALEGALIGLGIGGVTGATMVAGGSHVGLSTRDAAIVGGIVFGVLGTGVGLIIGVGLGSTEIFDLTKAPLATGSASTSQ